MYTKPITAAMYV